MTTYRRATTDPRHDMPIFHVITADCPAAADAIARRRHVEQAGGVGYADVVVTEPLIIAPRWRDLGGLNADLRGYQTDR